MSIFYVLCAITGFFYGFAILMITLRLVINIFRKQKESTSEIIKKLNPVNMYMNFQENLKYSRNAKINIAFALTVTSFIGIAMYIIPFTDLGTEDLSSEFRKKEFETYYYANLKPEDSVSKYYKLIVHVSYDRSSAHEGSSGVWINEIYFPNGGYIWMDYADSEIWMNEKTYIVDNEGQDWELELLDEKPNEKTLSDWKIIVNSNN